MKKANSKYNSERYPKPRQNLIIWLVKSACDDKIHKECSLKFGAGLPENVTSQRTCTARQTTSDHSSITACPLVLGHHPKQSKALCFTQFYLVTSCTVILQLHSCYHLGYGCTLSTARCHHIHFKIFSSPKNALTTSDAHSAPHLTNTTSSFLCVK